MAFGGRQNNFSYSFLQSSSDQGNDEDINGSTSGPLFQDQDTVSYFPWHQNTKEKPKSYTFPDDQSRKSIENNENENEADLQGLVSNILDESKSWDSCNTESLPTGNPLWSPKLRIKDAQFPKAEAKEQPNSSFPNQQVYKLFRETKKREDSQYSYDQSQQFIGFANTRSFFSFPTRDAKSSLPHKPPPGLSLPGMLTPDQYQIPQNKSVDMHKLSSIQSNSSMNDFLGLCNIFGPKEEPSNPAFDTFYKDESPQTGAHAIYDEQNIPDDVNQLVNGFQSFMSTHEHDNDFYEDYSNINNHTVGMCKEDNMTQKWKQNNASMPTQNTPPFQFPCQLLEDGQRGRFGGETRQLPKLDQISNYSGFSACLTECYQQPQMFPAPTKPPNQQQNRLTISKDMSSLNLNVHPKHDMEQEYAQGKSQKEKKTSQIPEAYANFPRIHRTNGLMLLKDRRPSPNSTNPFANFRGRMPPRKINGESNEVYVGNGKPPTAFFYSSNHLQSFSDSAASNFSPRSSLYNKSDGKGTGSVVSANSPLALNLYANNMWSQKRGGRFPSVVPASLMMVENNSVTQVSLYMDDCYEQWKYLEKERKKTESILRKKFPGKRCLTSNTSLPKIPPNSSRIDYLIASHFREQAKVSNLLEKMKTLTCTPLQDHIHAALKNHHVAVTIMQKKSKGGSITRKQHCEEIHFAEDKEFVVALKNLVTATRRLCSALWCALQVTLPQPPEGYNDYLEVTSSERCTSPIQPYSFVI